MQGKSHKTNKTLETYIPISYLNDFIFCPRSIYFHQLYNNFSPTVYQGSSQVRGLHAHQTLDTQRYSNTNDWITGLEVFNEEHKLCGKIDMYQRSSQTLRERKRHIKKLYDGYYLQVYAQYLCLKEMGYPVKKIELYDYTTNKIYPLPLPKQNPKLMKLLLTTLEDLKTFSLNQPFTAFKTKCQTCVYNNLCDYAQC